MAKENRTNISVRSYTEEGYQPVPLVRLSEKEYARSLQCFVPMCTDIVPIDRKTESIYLAQRKSKPMNGWWCLGGKMMPHETKEASAMRCLWRETGLRLPPNRFNLTAIYDWRWKDREQNPQAIGCHMASYLFIIEPTIEELLRASTQLNQGEYWPTTGLIAFNREKLVKEKVAMAMIDLYDHLFPANSSA